MSTSSFIIWARESDLFREELMLILQQLIIVYSNFVDEYFSVH